MRKKTFDSVVLPERMNTEKKNYLLFLKKKNIVLFLFTT